jgi:DNA (cytosine-5)-methyltransferase 1
VACAGGCSQVGDAQLIKAAEKRAEQLTISFTARMPAPVSSNSPVTPARIHRIAGLFAGIGGIELGMHRAGHKTILFCENDTAANAVLRARFDETRLKTSVAFHGDVTTLAALPNKVSLITAGFPCQDLSQAGSTKGIAGSRSGLVGEVFRLIRAHRVPWVLLENVPFMLQLGRGEAMNVITSAFEEMGYKWAYRVVDSRSFGLPQRRRRVYFVATNEGDPREILFADEVDDPIASGAEAGSAACGFYWTEGLRGLGWAVDAVPTLKGGSTVGIPSPPAIWLPDGRFVTPGIVDAERLQGFPRNWTKPAETVTRSGGRWKLVGNAVSVRAAQWIGRRMARPGRLRNFAQAPLRGFSWPTAAWNVGNGRVKVAASEWPLRRKYISLHDLLDFESSKQLSLKATTGFLSRAKQSKLRFPPGFIAAMERHRDRMEALTTKEIMPPGKSQLRRKLGRA